MDSNAKETNRPLDREELSPDQEAKAVGGFQVNPMNINTANFNTANLNISNLNTANFNVPHIDISK